MFFICVKLTQLDVDEDALRRETERNSDHEDCVCYLVEEFYAMSSRDNDCVNQTSQIEPRCKKERTNDGTLCTDSEDVEEEIGEQRTKGCAVLNVSD